MKKHFVPGWVMASPSYLRDLGVKLLGCMVWGARDCLALCQQIINDAKDLDRRMVENCAPAVACLSVMYGQPEKAMDILKWAIRPTVEEDVEAEHDQLMDDISCSHVARKGDGNSYTVGAILRSDSLMVDLGYTMEGMGIKRMRDGKIFIAPKIVSRQLLKGTNWQGQRLSDHIRRIDGAKRTTTTIHGRVTNGWSIPDWTGVPELVPADSF